MKRFVDASTQCCQDISKNLNSKENSDEKLEKTEKTSKANEVKEIPKILNRVFSYDKSKSISETVILIELTPGEINEKKIAE